MLDTLATPAYLPFAVALAIMVMIAVIEAVGAIIGIGISGFLDGMFFNLDASIDSANNDSISPYWLRALHVGKVPLLILVVILLTFFGLSGLLIQGISQSINDHTFPASLVSIPSLLIAIINVRFFGGIFSHLMPKDDTEAVDSSSFIGLVAVITLGVAKLNSPAQAKLVDQYGQTHYVMVEPDNEDDMLLSGTSVLLVKQESAIFRVIKNTFESLN